MNRGWTRINKLAVAEQKVNPLQPYFLVYVRDDGEVRYNFTHAKQVLEMFRLLAGGHGEPLDTLCTLFNHETCEGAEMAHYDALVEKTVLAIKQAFRKRNIGGLLSGRDGKLVGKAKQVDGADDFDLVTWLVIKGTQTSTSLDAVYSSMAANSAREQEALEWSNGVMGSNGEEE